MRRHRAPGYRRARGDIGDAEAALDVTQQSFIAAFAALARYDGARPFRVWMARIAINKCHDWTRRRAVRRLFSFALPLDAANDVADAAATPEGLILGRKQLERTRTRIARLPGRSEERRGG